jgi:hypothetical protein
MTIIDSFFSNLSVRFYSENNLSDFIWTCCESSEAFKQLFLNFFFEDINFSGPNRIKLVREYSDNGCRPDFVVFTNGTKTHLIEVKIYDRGHHFEQYEKGFEDIKNRGYIINYGKDEECLKNESEYVIKTWENFLLHLKSKTPNKESNIELNSFYKQIYSFIKNVCNYLEVTHMELLNLSSLELFNIAVLHIIENPSNKLISNGITIEKNKFEANISYSGFYFKIFHNNLPKRPLYLWFGIYYGGTEIRIQFENYDPFFCVQFKNKNILKEGNTFNFSKPNTDIIFDFKLKNDNEYFGINNNKSVEQQTTLLRDFFDESVEALILAL